MRSGRLAALGAFATLTARGGDLLGDFLIA
jgi:hypothetical protein